MGEAVGVPVGVPVGVGVGELPATATHAFMSEPGSTFVTVGFPKVGIVSPPLSIATVPVGEMEMTLELAAVAVCSVQFSLQMVKTGVKLAPFPSTAVECPSRLKLIVIGKTRLVPDNSDITQTAKIDQPYFGSFDRPVLIKVKSDTK